MIPQETAKVGTDKVGTDKAEKGQRPTDGGPLSSENQVAATRLGQTLKRLHRRISSRAMHELQAELTELDLSFSQTTALHQLRSGGATTVTGLAEAIHLSLPASSHLVERLVRRELVRRAENPNNRREKLVELSEAGSNVLDQMDSAFVNAYIAAFARMPVPDILAATEEMNKLLAQLEASFPLVENL